MTTLSSPSHPAATSTWGQRVLQWTAAAVAATGMLVILTNQLLLGHRASGKSIEWMQAAAWAIPTLLAWCAGMPVALHAARRWPLRHPLRARHIGLHAGMGVAICLGLVGAHVALSWIAGWIPRDVSILRFELVMTGRSYAGFNLVMYWSIVAWISAWAPPIHGPAEREPTSAEPFVVKIGNRRLLVPVDQVRWAEAAGNYVRLHTNDRAYLVRIPLKKLVDRLDASQFVQIHRSVIVRQSAVRELRPRASGDYEVTLTDGTTVTLSRRFRADALPKLTDRE